jgi:hypothetical protein
VCKVIQLGNSGAFCSSSPCVGIHCNLFLLDVEVSAKSDASNKKRVDFDKDIFCWRDDDFSVEGRLRYYFDTSSQKQTFLN